MLPAGEPEVKPAPPKPEPAKPVAVAPAAGGAAAIETPKKLVARLEKKFEKAKAEKPAAAQGAGRLELAVAPWGEVLVDGKSRGLSPPLRVLEIPAGPHTIEIRNSTFPAHVARVEVKAGEAVRIQHRFR
jgi:serine/threonine-protein kinase